MKFIQHVLSTPTHLDHRSPVKGDINKTYLYTGKTRHSKQIWTQPRLQINLFKIPTTKGHQILQSITKLKYSKCKSKGHDKQFVLYLPSPAHGSNTILTGCRIILQSYNKFYSHTELLTSGTHKQDSTQAKFSFPQEQKATEQR